MKYRQVPFRCPGGRDVHTGAGGVLSAPLPAVARHPDDLHLLARLRRLDAAGMDEAWVTLCHFFPVVEPPPLHP